MAIPALSTNADTRSLTERVNALMRDYNLQHSSFEVADLPGADSVPFGQRTFVTDADTPVLNDVVVGGGAVTTPIWSDLTDWRVG